MFRNVLYNNKPFGYECIGEGAAVVLLHGFGEDSSIWDFEKDALAQHFQLLIPDLPGSGGSPLLEHTTMDTLAGAVHFMLQQENITSCVLIGHSMGGYVALAFAEKYPALLRGLGLFHSSAYPDNDEKIATRQKGIQFIKQHGAFAFLKSTMPNLFSAATKERQPTLIEERINRVDYFAAEALIAYYNAMIKRPDRTAVLQNSAIPVLFVLGKWDNAVPLEAGLKQCTLPQTAYIHVLDQSGHMGMLEEPERSLAILHQYLSETQRVL